MTAHDPAPFADGALNGKRVLAVPPLGHKDLGKYLVHLLSAGKERWGWTVSVLAPTVDTKPFRTLTSPGGEVILPPHFLREAEWESDPRAVEEVDRKIREAETRTGFPVGRVILAAGHSIGRAYSAPFQHYNRYPMVLRVLRDNNEPLRIARRFFRFADDLLESNRPDFVFFFHWLIPLNMLVWLAAQRRGIPCIALRPSKLRSDHAFWTSDPFLLNVDAFEHARLKRRAHAPVSDAARERIANFRDQPSMIKYIASKWSNRMNLGFFRWHKQYARIVLSQVPDRFRGQDMSAREGELARFLRYYRTLFVTYYHQHVFTTLDENALAATKYIYFPMHKEAEFAQTFQATTWHDQRNTIRILASMLPMGYRLLVREHRMNFGRRRTRSYREIAQLPNVTLIDPFDSQFKYLRHADIVVTENGSSGWEGLLLARRTLILAEHTFYQGADQGAVVTDPDRLNATILDLLSKPAVADLESHDHALAAMVDAEYETTFLMNPAGIVAGLDMLELRFAVLAARSRGQRPSAVAGVIAPAPGEICTRPVADRVAAGTTMMGAASSLPVLHVGFHKCGSTTLQGALFNRHPEIDYLGEPREEPRSTEAIKIVRDFCCVDERKRMPFDQERSRSLWREALSDIAPGKVAVFSKELLTQPEFYASPDDRRLPERLRAVVGPARIVIVTRHQIRLIELLYLFQTKGVRAESPQQWLEARRDDLRQYRFHTVAQSFAAAFGRENVAIFPFEDMRTDAEGLARRICGFIGVDPEQGAELIAGERRNQRVSQRYLAYSKMRKALGLYVPVTRLVPEAMRRRFNDFVAGGREARIDLPATFVAKMEDYFRDDNRRLSQDWGIPVEKYGYPV